MMLLCTPGQMSGQLHTLGREGWQSLGRVMAPPGQISVSYIESSEIQMSLSVVHPGQIDQHTGILSCERHALRCGTPVQMSVSDTVT